MKFIERFSRKPAPQQPVVEASAAPLLMALEPRIMFDASVGVVAQDAAAQTTAEAAKDSTSTDTSTHAPAAATADASTQQASQRQEVVFIDGNVTNIEQLLAGLSGKPEVVILDPNKDGLQQMADYLKGREGLDAIHLLSHGSEGTVQMGNVWLNSGNLAEHATELQSIGAALKADGDLMLYGCKVGEDGKGEAFIDDLAAMTGADVAASTDDTGATSLGGNWSLERSSGPIETVALGAELSAYDSLLAVNYTTGAGPTHPSNALARYVVGDFNNDGIDDILFQPGTDGTAWQIAIGSSTGVFSYYAASDATNSPFSNVSLINASGNGTNYYAADFDRDGDVDLLGVTVSNGAAYLYRYDAGTGKYTREVASGFTDATLGVRLVVGDYNGDGAADILYTPAAANTWRYAQNNGDGTFTSMDLIASPFAGLSPVAITTYNYRAVDFDGDGDIDVFAFVNNTTGVLYRNNGDNTFSSASTANLPTVIIAARTVLGDFDGDGDADILWQIADNGAWKYSSQNADGTFTAAVDLINSPFGVASLPNMGFQNVRFGDFDGDGDIDVIATTAATSATIYYQSGGLPKLISATPSDNSLNVAPSANITLTFSESVTPGTGSISIVRLSDGMVVQTILANSASVTGSGTTWTIDPPIDLAQGTAYAIRVDSKAFANADGKTFKGIVNNSALNFTTATVQPPVIGNFNGDAIAYVEGAPYALLDDGGNATVTDADSSNFSGGKLTVQITTGLSSGEDVLFIRDEVAGANKIILSGASIMYNGLVIGTYTGGSNGNPLVVTFTSNANPTTVAALVHNLAYRNSNSTEPSTTPRTVSVSMDDGAGGNSTVSTILIEVHPVNDAPVVNVTASNPTYTENTSAVQLFSGATINTVEAGQKIAQMTFTVSTVYNGAAEKLLIDGSDVTLINGTTLTTNNNSITVTVSVSSGTANVTLTSSAGLDVATAQTVLNTMAYRNDSESPNTANRVVTLNTLSDNGGTDNGGIPTSAVGIASTVTVVGINDAPVLAGAPYSLPSINEDTTSSGMRISTLLTNYTMVDPDVGALRGIAVITKSGNGIWQYSTDNATWTDFGAVSSTSALLLASTTYIRYVPDGANGETASLTFRAWDQTTGSASVNGIRGTADTSSNGGTTAFSIITAVTNQPVTAVNDAPVMSAVFPTLTGLNDTSTNNAGNLVSSLVGGVTDVDSGAVKGIAITGLTATYGKWQFSVDNGSTWTDVGAVSNATALILNVTNKVRFVPDGVHGETATIIYKAWDQSSGAGLEGTKRDTTISGGTSAYSTGTDTASVVVTAVNDAPVVTVSGGAASWSEGNNVASNPVAVDTALTLSDPDGPNPLNATAKMLTYFSSQDTLSFVNDGLTMGNIVGTWTVGTGTLTLTSAGNQATVAQFEAALRAITYNNSSNSPNSTTRTVQFIVTDGSNAQSTAVTRDITITAVNNSPTISAPATLPINEDTLTALGQITFSDVDSTIGTVTFSVGSGTFSAIGSGGVSVGGTQTAITLSGTLANINLFIASNKLNYTPAANASGDVTLTINVNTTSVSDATTTVTLQVAAVNDAPVVTAPASIGVTEDVSSVISGISFSDVDAGANTVVATFSVPSGTLSASSGSGVTVSGADTGVLTLSGSLADINAFISANSLTFKTALNSTTNVVLTVTLNDKGFSGSGGEQTDTKTVTLNVTAVNDAPVNNVPGAQTAQQNIALGFNTANGNAISITDVDAGNGLMTVTLTATNGTLSLGSLSGITLIIGTGTNNAALMFEGTRANLNAALQTLSFKSGSNYLGAASLTIETNDNGNSGGGGAKTDTDVISINVIPVNPKVTSVSAQGIDRTVKIGDEVLINMSWDQVVNVDTNGGSPTLLLETGLVDREAVYVSGSGSNTLVFKYTVQAGDLSADLDFQSAAALQLNGAVLANASNDLAVLTLPTVGGADSLGGRSNIVVDGAVPVVANVQAPTNGTYIIGQNLDFTVNFSENVVVDSTGGVPRLAVTLDTGGTVYADYVSGSGGSALVFRLTVASGQLDSTGVTLGSALQLNGGSIRDTAGNDTVVTLNSVASTANVNVDGVVPAVVSVTAPLDGSYKAGDVLTFTVNASEALQTGGLPPRLVLDVGGVTRYATYVSGSGSAALVFQYIVQAGDNDSDGIAISSLDLRGEQLTDLAGNDLNLSLNGVGSTAGVVVDTTAPSAGNIVRVDATPSNNGSVSFTVTFSEDVSGVDANDFSLVFGGNAAGSISSVTAVDGHTYTVVVGGLTGTGSLRLDLDNSGTGIVDKAGNAVTGGLTGASYAIDRDAPSVTSVDAPSNGTYVAGQNLDFTVHLDEAVQLDTSNGTPRIAVTLDDGTVAYATYLSGAGSNALVFRMTVAGGQLDTNGVAVGSAIDLNGATLRDAVGNDANLALNNVASTAGVQVDAVAPVVDSVTLPPDGSYRIGDVLSFTVNTSEHLVLDTSTGTPVLMLNVAGIPRYAMYVSGGADGAMVFQYTVQPGENASGISVTSLNLNGATARDAAGNAMVVDIHGVGDGSGIVIDNTAPIFNGINPLTSSPTGAASVEYSVAFNEKVTGLDLSALTLTFGGTLQGAIESITSVDGKTYVVKVSGLTGEGTARLSINNANSIKDVAGNSLQPVSGSYEYRVDRVDPTVVSVSAPAAGTYGPGQNLDFTVTMDENIQMLTNGNTPTIEVNLGNGQTALATYVNQTGSRTLLFRLTVASGQIDSDGITLGSSINLNGAVLRDSVRNNADTTLKGVGDTSQVLVDGVAPTVASVSVPAAGTYGPGQNLDFTVTMDEDVQLLGSGGTPTLEVNLGNGQTALATYVGQTGNRTLLFRMTVTSGQVDSDGVTLGTSINLNGAVLRDSVGNNADTTLKGVGDSSQVLVDGVAPTVTAVNLPAAGNYTVGGVLRFDVAVSENVNVDTSTGTPRLLIDVGGVTRYATYVSGSGSARLVFEYTVVAGDNANGIAVGNSLDLNGGSLRDGAGNGIDPALNGPVSNAGVVIDTAPPVPVNIVADGAYQASDRSQAFTLTFNEAVSGVDVGDFTLVSSQSASGVVQSVQQIDARTYRIVVGNITGQGSLALNLNAAGSGIRDVVGNQMGASLASSAASIPNQDVGDLEYRLNPPQNASATQPSVIQPQIPGLVINSSVSPLVPGSLFEIRSVGGDLQPLGTIFLGAANSAPSFIAQVFGSSDSGVNGQGGLSSFANGSNSVFGSSTLSAIFGHDVPGVSEMNVFNGSQWRPADINQGLRGAFGAPSFGQQLQQLNEAEKRHVRELAQALAQPAQIGQQA